MRFLGRFLREFAIFSLVVTALGTAGYFGYQWWQEKQLLDNRPKVTLAKDKTNTNAAWQNFSTYQARLRNSYSFINKVSNYVPPRTWDGKDFVIPGLRSTVAYNYKKKKWERIDTMTPQGVTIAGKYLLITAYDGEHVHNSVIYVLDKKTGKYLKTIQIDGRPHLGGITYDPEGKNIWITGSMGESSGLMSFSMRALKNYLKGSRQTIWYNHKIAIPNVQKASTVTYYDDQLFVGFFTLSGRGKVAAYTIARSGKYKNSIANNEVKSVTGRVSWSDPNGQTTMSKQIQGIAIYQNKIFLSQSYGSSSSKLYIFPITALKSLSEKNAEEVITMPPYLEQITAYKGQLICIFESGAKQYAKPNSVIMDRTLSLNINALFGD